MISTKKIRLESQTGRVKNKEQSEDKYFLKVSKIKELKASTAEIFSERAFRKLKDTTEVTKRFKKKSARFSRKNN